jgi:hydroxyacylglutathione hydrolase
MDESSTTLKLGSVNAYLLKASGGFVLIDSGFPWQWASLKAALESEGCVPGTLRLVVLTHGDIDHCGNCAQVRHEYGAPIAVHREDVSEVETGIRPDRSSPTLLGKTIVLMGAAMYKLRGKVHLETFGPDLILDGGESLEGYGLKASVIHLPGHTKGSVAILTEDGSLFAGDTFFNMKHASQPIQDVEDYRASLEKIRPFLHQIRTVYPGHGKSFPGARISRITI